MPVVGWSAADLDVTQARALLTRAIRLLLNPDDTGLLGWVPGGFPVQLTGYLVAAAVGIVLASVNARPGSEA